MLEKDGWLENSVIVVASDNGACPSDGGTNYPLRGTKQSMYEGGSKVRQSLQPLFCFRRLIFFLSRVVLFLYSLVWFELRIVSVS